MKKYLLVFIAVLFILLAAGCSSDSNDDKQGNSNISADSTDEGYSNGSLNSEALVATPTEVPTQTKEETPEPEEKVTKLEDVEYNKNSESKGEVVSLEDAKAEESIEMNKIDSTEEEYQKALTKQGAEESKETSALTETLVSEKTQKSTAQLSEAKKKELIGIIKEYYSADKVEVDYFSPKDASQTGLVSVTYYLAVPPAKNTLENDLFGIVWASKQTAEASGIVNPNVNVVVMLTDEITPLGVGNYYSSTEKTDILVEDVSV